MKIGNPVYVDNIRGELVGIGRKLATVLIDGKRRFIRLEKLRFREVGKRYNCGATEREMKLMTRLKLTLAQVRSI